MRLCGVRIGIGASDADRINAEEVAMVSPAVKEQVLNDLEKMSPLEQKRSAEIVHGMVTPLPKGASIEDHSSCQVLQVVRWPFESSPIIGAEYEPDASSGEGRAERERRNTARCRWEAPSAGGPRWVHRPSRIPPCFTRRRRSA